MSRENRDGEYISVGRDVFVVDSGFYPVVQQGKVVEKRELRNEDFNEVDVYFASDPMNRANDNERTISAMTTQVINVDASVEELADKFGLPGRDLPGSS